MARFAFVYHGGAKPSDPADFDKIMTAWNAWYGSMGEALVDGGGPAGLSKTVSREGTADNGGSNPVAGLTIIDAADQAAACKIAEQCPMVVDGTGSAEVVEILSM
ncbi:MAG: hypothetical protein ABJO27_24580 [Pseudoruegeria sp.]